jgi:integrase
VNATVHALRPGDGLSNGVGQSGGSSDGIGQFPAECGICGVPHAGGCRIVARHLEHLRLLGRAETTIYDRGRVLHRLGAALPVPVLDATEAHLLAWRAALTVSAKSIGTYVMHIAQFYRFAVAEGLIESSPAEHLPVPRPPQYLPRPIGEADLMRALEQAPPRVRPWLALAAWGGLRACEISALRAQNVVLDGPCPFVLIASDATKGGRHERIVPLSPFLVAELRAAHLPARGFAFPRLDGRPGPMRAWSISKMGCEALHAAGCADTFHSLRHRMLTMAYRASRDLRLVQDLAGHGSPATTALYTLVDRPSAAAAVSAIPVPGETQ